MLFCRGPSHFASVQTVPGGLVRPTREDFQGCFARDLSFGLCLPLLMRCRAARTSEAYASRRASIRRSYPTFGGRLTVDTLTNCIHSSICHPIRRLSRLAVDTLTNCIHRSICHPIRRLSQRLQALRSTSLRHCGAEGFNEFTVPIAF